MEWIILKYEHGGNPYIIKTEKELKRIKKKYNDKLMKLDKKHYFVIQ